MLNLSKINIRGTPSIYTKESKKNVRNNLIKTLRKGKGAGRPMQPIKHSSREKLNRERDEKLATVLKDLKDMREKI